MRTTNLSMLALGLVMTSTAAAQEQDSAVSQLNTVVVTATKFAKKQSETGKVLTVITREQIERNIGRMPCWGRVHRAGVIARNPSARRRAEGHCQLALMRMPSMLMM